MTNHAECTTRRDRTEVTKVDNRSMFDQLPDFAGARWGSLEVAGLVTPALQPVMPHYRPATSPAPTTSPRSWSSRQPTATPPAPSSKPTAERQERPRAGCRHGPAGRPRRGRLEQLLNHPGVLSRDRQLIGLRDDRADQGDNEGLSRLGQPSQQVAHVKSTRQRCPGGSPAARHDRLLEPFAAVRQTSLTRTKTLATRPRRKPVQGAPSSAVKTSTRGSAASRSR